MAGHIATAGNASWCTPPEILDAVREAFDGIIGLDPCSNPDALVGAEKTFTLPVDGLEESWDAKSVFVNPPFGVSYISIVDVMVRPSPLDKLEILYAKGSCISAKEKQRLEKASLWKAEDWKKQSIKDWVSEAHVQADLIFQNNVALLIPAAVDTAHWQKTIFEHAGAVCFIKGRVHFYEGGVKSGPAPMACAIVGFGPFSRTDYFDSFDSLGKVVYL